MKLVSVLSRSRLLTINLIALTFLLAALAFSPVDVAADPGWTCETGCVH